MCFVKELGKTGKIIGASVLALGTIGTGFTMGWMGCARRTSLSKRLVSLEKNAGHDIEMLWNEFMMLQAKVIEDSTRLSLLEGMVRKTKKDCEELKQQVYYQDEFKRNNYPPGSVEKKTKKK